MSHGCLMCKELLCGWGGDSQSRARHELQVETREDPCSDSAPSIVVGTIRLLVEQQECLSICADERLCKGMTNYCSGSHHVGLEEEGPGKGGKLRSFFFACVFSSLKKTPTKSTQVWSTPVVFLTINQEKNI